MYKETHMYGEGRAIYSSLTAASGLTLANGQIWSQRGQRFILMQTGQNGGTGLLKFNIDDGELSTNRATDTLFNRYEDAPDDWRYIGRLSGLVLA
jgi:hypothetical protein